MSWHFLLLSVSVSRPTEAKGGINEMGNQKQSDHVPYVFFSFRKSVWHSKLSLWYSRNGEREPNRIAVDWKAFLPEWKRTSLVLYYVCVVGLSFLSNFGVFSTRDTTIVPESFFNLPIQRDGASATYMYVVRFNRAEKWIGCGPMIKNQEKTIKWNLHSKKFLRSRGALEFCWSIPSGLFTHTKYEEMTNYYLPFKQQKKVYVCIK